MGRYSKFEGRGENKIVELNILLGDLKTLKNLQNHQ